MEQFLNYANIILSLFGALCAIGISFGGPFAYLRIKKYFPERSEVVTKEVLEGELEKIRNRIDGKLDAAEHRIKDAENAEVGRLRLSIDSAAEHFEKLLDERKKLYDERHTELQRRISKLEDKS